MRDIPAWLRSASPGRKLIYYDGSDLSRDRLCDPEFDQECAGWTAASDAGLVQLNAVRLPNGNLGRMVTRTKELSE